MDGLQQVVTDSVSAALKAVNTPNPEDRPAQEPASAPAVVTRRAFPSLTRALKAKRAGNAEKVAGFELEVSNAAKALWYSSPGDDVKADSIVWPANLNQAIALFDFMGERKATKELDRLDSAIKSLDAHAIKAMGESGSYSLSGGTSGGILVPPEFLQSLFAYALTPAVALRNVPGVQTLQVNSNNVRLPRESARAGASQASEAGTLSAADATLAQQSIVIEKQYAFRRWSNELADDSNPSFMQFLGNTVVRDLGVQQDSQYLQGNGSTPQIQGIIGYSGLTTATSVGANGGTPTFDNFHDAVYSIDLANAKANFLITHPRTWNSLRKIKDSTGRYLASASFGVPVAFGANGGPTKLLLDYIPVVTTTSLSIALTVGSSSDCTTAILGDASQVYILERGGIEIDFSEHLYFATDEVAVRAIGRSAVAILQPAAVTTITGIRP